MDALLAVWQEFILGLGRVLTLVMLAPVLGSYAVPRSIKVVTAMMLTAVCIHFTPGSPSVMLPIITFGVALVKEMTIGYLMAMTLLLLLAAFQAAGELMGFQMMFSAGTAFLPISQEQSTVMGNFMYIFSLLVFISLSGHHWLIAALHQSFRTLPVLALPASLGSPATWVGFFGKWFTISLQLALPLLATLLITNLLLGMIARTMPQINVFVIGMPIQILVGLLVLGLMIGSLYQAEAHFYQAWGRNLLHWVRMIGP